MDLHRHGICSHAAAILAAALTFGVCSAAQCKYHPVDTGTAIRSASVVAVIRVQWIQPGVQQSGSGLQDAYVTATVLETYKGQLPAKTVVIKTDSRSRNPTVETVDYAAYCPEHTYLVFLVRSGSVHKAVTGRFGVFPIDDRCEVHYWNKPGVWRSYPDVPPTVNYKVVRKQIVDYLSKRSEYHPIKNAPVYNCVPVQPSPYLISASMKTIAQQSSFIAVIETQWVKPADQSGNRQANIHSRVEARVIEVIKGDKRIKNVIIGTKTDTKSGDAGSFAPMRRQLVFLKQDDGLYRSVNGRYGVFDMAYNDVVGWPQNGQSKYPRSSNLVKITTVAKAINTLSSAK